MTFSPAPALPEELDKLMRRMRLPCMRKAAPDVLATARGPTAADRRGVHRLRHRHPSSPPLGELPHRQDLRFWRAEDSTIPEPTQNSLITLERIGRAESLVIAGPSGTGKSHFTEVWPRPIGKALRVSWFTLETLSATIGKSKVDGATARTVARIRRADLIVIDDIGLLPVGEFANVRRQAVVIQSMRAVGGSADNTLAEPFKARCNRDILQVRRTWADEREARLAPFLRLFPLHHPTPPLRPRTKRPPSPKRQHPPQHQRT